VIGELIGESIPQSENSKHRKPYILACLPPHTLLQRHHQMAGRDPPFFLNTDEDRGAIVAVMSFTTIAVSTFTNIIRVWTRQKSEAALGLDDVLLIAANVSIAV
jgi:hypothetical protein